MINLAQNGLSHSEVIRKLQSDWLGRLRYRIDVVKNNTPIGTLDYKNASIQCESTSQVKYGGRVTAHFDPIDSNKEMIQFVQYIEDGPLFEFKFAPLRPVTISEAYGAEGKLMTIEAMDNTTVLQNNSLGRKLFIPKGSNYTSVITEIIRGRGFDIVDITPTEKLFSYDREEWGRGDRVLVVINGLAQEINYRDLEVGIDGILRLRPYTTPTIEQAKISYNTLENSIIYPDKSVEYDSWGRPNVFTASVFTQDMTIPLTATYENKNPADPTSLANSPFRIVEEVSDINNIADQASLYSLLRRRADESSQSYQGSLKTAIMPHHEVGEVLHINSNGIAGVWEETSWNIADFSSNGQMQHRLRRINI